VSGIFGIVRRDGAAVDPEMMASMRRAMAFWGRDGSEVVVKGCAGLGHALTISTSEEKLERLPFVDAAAGGIFTAEGRVDNREELLRDLRMPAAHGDPARSPDGEIMFRAYQRWGVLGSRRLIGDWSFAAWDPTRRQFFLARDHLGNTSVYYNADARIFAFASSLDALLALDLGAGEMDEFFLAQVLVSWPAYHGPRTIRKHIRRLPPAHALTVADSRLDIGNSGGWRTLPSRD
jgi:asparagine synthase (glutamine-hydrolysing)